MLNKQDVLDRTNGGYLVFRHYINTKWQLGKNFLNPLYEDKKASCNIYYDRKSRIYKLKDFGNDDYSGDCFFFVGKLKGLNCFNSKGFVDILEIINRDMNLGLNEIDRILTDLKTESVGEQTAEVPKGKPYIVLQQNFSENELSFWRQYGITEEILRTYKVCSVKEFRGENKDKEPYLLRASAEEPIFGYLGKKFMKIYRPLSEVRFLYGGNPGENYCFGLEQIPLKGDTLFITGGEKDVLSLVSHGFYAICFNSETSMIPASIIRKLSHRFKHIVILYDVDETGLKSSLKHQQQLSEFGVKRIVLPLSGAKTDKDISDYFKTGKTRENFSQLFLEFLDSLYSDTMAVLKPCEIDFCNPPVKVDMIVSINGVPLGTQGNLFGITGGEGTGKSNYVGSLIAGAIRDKDVVIDSLGTDVNTNSGNKAVLLYDTEQSEEQLYKNISNVLRRGKLKLMPPYFKAYCLTSMSRKERLQSIVHSMDKFHYQYGGIQMVVVDGIADLVRCANDEAESVGLIDELYRLAGIYKTCIICVLHFVPNGMKLRGHLGSELQRKAAAILSIEKDDNPAISVIKALKVRDGSPLDIPLIQFAWNKEIGMHTYIGEKSKEEKEKRKENELISVARTIFSRERHVNYMDLCEQIQSVLDVKERTAKGYIKFMRDKELILKDPSNSAYYIIGYI